MVISEDQLNQAQKRLQTELEDTTREIQQIDEQVRMFGENEVAEGVDNHIGDDSDAIYEQERLMTIRGPLTQRRQQIEEALQRIDKGEYGTCARCGQPIAPERLEALPFVGYCIECQELEDGRRERGR